MFNKSILLVCVLSLSLAGCSSMKRMTGQIDDSVLPGQREGVLPPDQTVARDPNVSGGPAAPGSAIQQQTLNQPGAPQTGQPGDLQPGTNGTVVKCDPLVQTCPGMEPQPAQKPVVAGKKPVVKSAKVAAKSTKVKPGMAAAPVPGTPPGQAPMIDAGAGKPPAGQAAAAATAGDAAAPQAGVTDPMKPELAKHKKKKIKKPKLTLKTKVADPNAPADPNAAPADPNAPAAPAPLVAPDAQIPKIQ